MIRLRIWNAWSNYNFPHPFVTNRFNPLPFWVHFFLYDAKNKPQQHFHHTSFWDEPLYISYPCSFRRMSSCTTPEINNKKASIWTPRSTADRSKREVERRSSKCAETRRRRAKRWRSNNTSRSRRRIFWHGVFIRVAIVAKWLTVLNFLSFGALDNSAMFFWGRRAKNNGCVSLLLADCLFSKAIDGRQRSLCVALFLLLFFHILYETTLLLQLTLHERALCQNYTLSRQLSNPLHSWSFCMDDALPGKVQRH